MNPEKIKRFAQSTTRASAALEGRQWTPMVDGLYQVTTPYLCAGFVVIENGVITMCAPILRKKINYWRTIAKRVGD